MGQCYTALKTLSRDMNIGYSSLIRGKRVFVENDSVIVITEVEVKRVLGRSNNYEKKIKIVPERVEERVYDDTSYEV